VLLFMWDAVLQLPSGSTEDNVSFTEMGGHSLSAARLSSAVKRTFAVTIPLVPLLRGQTPSQQARAIEQAWQAEGGRVGGAAQRGHDETDPQKLVQAVRQAAVLEPVEAHTGGVKKAQELGPGTRCVLLTGATGFVGSHLLRELLKQVDPQCKVVCVCRGGRERLVKQQKAQLLWDEVTRLNLSPLTACFGVSAACCAAAALRLLLLSLVFQCEECDFLFALCEWTGSESAVG